MADIPRRQLLGWTAGLAFAVGSWGFLADGCDTRAETQVDQLAADHVVSTTTELEAAFDALSSGETLVLTGENAPYRTNRWLDIDVDDVTIVGSGASTLVKPADGTNVGGIRIGANRHCENVTVRGVGYHGNPSGQRSFAKRLHGIIVQDAENVILSGNYLTRTHPYHDHNEGGSGISAERECRNVRILGNRIDDIGDRGIQVAGQGVVVAGNVVTDGFDRSISCDVWRSGNHQQGRNISVVGNVMGDNSEGSLTGVGGNDAQTDRGYVLIADNVGFGSHKSFCHIGFEGAVHDVRIEGNVSVAGRSDFAGISLDIERASNVTVVDNDLSDYGGSGIKVEDGISEFTVSRNSISDVDSDGIRIVGASDGTVAHNTVAGTGRAGILLDDARFVDVESNRVRNVERAGIVAHGSDRGGHEISDNRVRSFGRAGGHDAGILIRTEGNVVRGNRIHQSDGPAIVEGDGGGDTLYGENWANGRKPWLIDSATSIVRDHVPAFDVHRGLVADELGVVTLQFDKPYTRRPRLTFGRVGGGVQDISYVPTQDGGFDGVMLTVGSPRSSIDVFVESIR
ncbi:right-handed parallel beta-helix repeat-containing protein [Haladaptatus sp. NG-SE-30]